MTEHELRERLAAKGFEERTVEAAIDDLRRLKLIDDAAPLRLRVPAGGDLAQDSDLLLDQLRAIDNNRLVKGPLLRCTEALLAEVDQALREVLDLG